jgi:D-alanine-D-alanine ligase
VPTAIKNALVKNGYSVELLEADEGLYEKLRYGPYGFVFNIAEGIRGESRESHVPAMLEMLGIPFTGSSIQALAITLDKRRTKEILQHYGIPTPRFQMFKNAAQKLNPELQFPLFVKPNSEGSSKGIRNNSLVKNEEELRNMLKFVTKNYGQEALVEEFLDGREFTVAVLGNSPPKVLPIVEITFDYLPPNVNKFDSYEVKWYWDNPTNPVDPVVCPAKISKQLEYQIKRIAIASFKATGCVDLCRMDFRLDKHGVPNVIEINALPGLMPDPLENSRFPKACFTAGMTYDEIIMAITTEAMKRQGLIQIKSDLNKSAKQSE